MGEQQRPRQQQLRVLRDHRAGAQLGFHAVERFDVRLDPQPGLLAGEAHDQPREAVAGHLVAGARLALDVDIGRAHKIVGATDVDSHYVPRYVYINERS